MKKYQKLQLLHVLYLYAKRVEPHSAYHVVALEKSAKRIWGKRYFYWTPKGLRKRGKVQTQHAGAGGSVIKSPVWVNGDYT